MFQKQWILHYRMHHIKQDLLKLFQLQGLGFLPTFYMLSQKYALNRRLLLFPLSLATFPRNYPQMQAQRSSCTSAMQEQNIELFFS